VRLPASVVWWRVVLATVGLCTQAWAGEPTPPASPASEERKKDPEPAAEAPAASSDAEDLERTLEEGEVKPVSRVMGQRIVAQTPTFGPPSRPFWDGRRAAIASGFAASAAAAYMAMSAERDLRDTRNRLLQVPPGATDEWNALLDEATGQERTRNFWWGAVAGVSGVTLAYMLASESPDRAPRPFPAGALTLPGRWRLHVNPALPFLMLRRSF
jgi:hypothetical protein